MGPMMPVGMGPGRFLGRIKSFNPRHGFGFIDCPDARSRFGRDVFVHKAQIGGLEVGDDITFSVEPNKDGMPQARDILRIDGRPPGPTPPHLLTERKRKANGGSADGEGAAAGSGRGRARRRGGKGKKKLTDGKGAAVEEQHQQAGPPPVHGGPPPPMLGGPPMMSPGVGMPGMPMPPVAGA